MPRGSLYDLLHGAAGVVVDTAQAVRFALDIARGMAYLHSLERIVPRYYLNSYHVMVMDESQSVFFIYIKLGQQFPDRRGLNCTDKHG